MSKTQQQNGMMPGNGTMPDGDDFSDGESTPLTQDYGDRYIYIYYVKYIDKDKKESECIPRKIVNVV